MTRAIPEARRPFDRIGDLMRPKRPRCHADLLQLTKLRSEECRFENRNGELPKPPSNMSKTEIHRHTITSACILTVETGTNCPQGGDSGHGGRTVFRLNDDASTDLNVGVDGESAKKVTSVEIVLGGDCEAECFAQALEFAARTIRSQMDLRSTTKGEEEHE